MPATPEAEQVKSVGELTSSIKRLLEGGFSGLWVKGEVSNLRYQSSGHIYFSLKDKDAQISAVMFRGNASKLSFKLKDGMELIAYGGLSVYEPRGSYQLIVRHCIEEGTGRLQAEFERLKAKLKNEGLFDFERKKTIPVLPRRVGIVTSPTGAALRDFLSILRRREWTGEIFIFPAIVQGDEGASSIIQGIQKAQDFGSLDLLVIGRGGGSLEDLWNFNEEMVVRAVADCEIPVISAVGHEIDFVLTDFAADKRAETPSAAAELISSGYVEAKKRMQVATDRLRTTSIQLLQHKKLELNNYRERLKSVSPEKYIQNRHLRIDDLQERLKSRIHMALERKRNSSAMLGQRIFTIEPKKEITILQNHLDNLKGRLTKEAIHQSKLHSEKLESLGKRLGSLGVEQVLNRGFTITRDHKGRICESSEMLKDGQLLKTEFKDGNVTSFVQKRQQLDLFGEED